MKKSQIFGIPLIYLFSIVAVVLIFFGILGIRHLNESSREAQLTNFFLTLQNKLTANRLNANSISQETFALPYNIGSVCFVDTSKDIIPFTNKKLNEKIKAFPDHSLFMEPLNLYPPHKLVHLLISEFENPLCVKVFKGKLRLNLEGYGNNTRVSVANEDEKESECVYIVYNKMPEESIDVVFLGYGYTNNKAFSSDVNKYVNDVFLKMEPFKSDKDKFNFYRVDDFDLKCTIEDYIKCDQYITNLVASNCPHDYIFILIDRNVLADFVDPVRSSAVSNIAKINTADNVFVLMHEFGHTFAGLADEYVDTYYETVGFDEEDYPNCDELPCGEWNAVEDTGCYDGCSLNQYFRPTQTSIMRELSSREYGPVNTGVITEITDRYGGQGE